MTFRQVLGIRRYECSGRRAGNVWGLHCVHVFFVLMSTLFSTSYCAMQVAKTLSRSTEVMKMVNTAMKLPEMQKTMVEMSKGRQA
jgi:hypothetical protein